MLKRLLTGALALIIAGAAVAIPIMLTEAGTRSTSSVALAQASFEYTDPGTGYHYYGYASGQIGTTTSTSSGGGGGGGGGGSQKPHISGKPSSGYTYTFEDVWAYIDVYDAEWNFIGGWDGSLSNGGAGFGVDVAGDLSSAHLEANIAAYGYGAFDDQTAELLVDLEFVATGAAQTSRDRYQSHIKSPRQSYAYSTTSARRPAEATGTLGVGGVNVAEDGSQYAVIGLSDLRARSSY